MNTFLQEATEIELQHLIEQDVCQASGYFEMVGEIRVIDQGQETDEWYREEQFGGLSFFHTLCNGRKVHVRVCIGD
jgi:hypothetical protein